MTHALRALTQSALTFVVPTDSFQTSIRKRGEDKTMPRAAHMKVFDVGLGKESKWTMEQVHALVKRAALITRVSTDALVKDKAGHVMAEIWDYAKYIRWVEEHPEGPTD